MGALRDEAIGVIWPLSEDIVFGTEQGAHTFSAPCTSWFWAFDHVVAPVGFMRGSSAGIVNNMSSSEKVPVGRKSSSENEPDGGGSSAEPGTFPPTAFAAMISSVPFSLGDEKLKVGLLWMTVGSVFVLPFRKSDSLGIRVGAALILPGVTCEGALLTGGGDASVIIVSGETAVPVFRIEP